MNTIKTIIIDDEEHNRNLLSSLLKKHCPSIEICNVAVNADEAFSLINLHKPQLIFLDIRMPGKSGFDLLKQFSEIDFEVIFVSAFDEYAITAFDFNALGYILKPIDYVKLLNVIEKAIIKINSNYSNQDVLNFAKTISDNSELINKIAVHHNDKVILVNINEIVSVKGGGNICELKLIDNTCYFSSKDLRLFENLLEKVGNFIRISRSVIINVDCVKSYSKGDICTIELANGLNYELPRRKKAEVLNKMKII